MMLLLWITEWCGMTRSYHIIRCRLSFNPNDKISKTMLGACVHVNQLESNRLLGQAKTLQLCKSKLND